MLIKVALLFFIIHLFQRMLKKVQIKNPDFPSCLLLHLDCFSVSRRVPTKPKKILLTTSSVIYLEQRGHDCWKETLLLSFSKELFGALSF